MLSKLHRHRRPSIHWKMIRSAMVTVTWCARSVAIHWRAPAYVALCLLGLHLSACRGTSEDDGLTSVTPTQPYRYPAPPRLVAIGDLHGDRAAAEQVLRLAGAINLT